MDLNNTIQILRILDMQSTVNQQFLDIVTKQEIKIMTHSIQIYLMLIVIIGFWFVALIQYKKIRRLENEKKIA